MAANAVLRIFNWFLLAYHFKHETKLILRSAPTKIKIFFKPKLCLVMLFNH